MVNVSNDWYKHKPEDKENIINILKNSEKTLDIVENMVYNLLVDARSISASDYSDPNWSHRAAHQNGQADILLQILRILDVTKKGDHTQSKLKRKSLTDAKRK